MIITMGKAELMHVRRVARQDGVTSHTAKTVQSWYKENFTVFWSKKFWPPSSPDLNPMDFGVWSMLEHKACATSHKNFDALKHSLEKSWNEISPKTLRTTCSQVIDRLRCMIRAKGGLFRINVDKSESVFVYLYFKPLL